MSETKSPLARLVLFMVCLSVAGAIVAGVHYLVIDQPQQNAGTPPMNFDLQDCRDECLESESYCETVYKKKYFWTDWQQLCLKELDFCYEECNLRK